MDEQEAELLSVLRGTLAGDRAQNAAEKLARYGYLMLEKNRVMNLTAITTPHEIAQLHMLDCAALLDCGIGTGKLLDVGTGAGLPGMVLKILCPALEVTLLDSTQKRLSWLDEVCGELSLTGIGTLYARAEDAGRDGALRETFDFVTARAVARLNLLCELCLPFLRVGGQFLAMKAVDCEDEVSEAEKAVLLLGGRYLASHDYTIPGTDVRRRILRIEKISKTPAQYPRRFAQMKKKPLM